MEVSDSDLLAYLRHRLGDVAISSRNGALVRKALELNKPQPDFSSSFGDPDIRAYVGFIDLAGFSEVVRDKSPREIADYILPFLERSIGILRSRGALIDKTIGDEVMFVLPETEEDPNPPEVLFLGQICGALHDLAYELGSRYRYRLGLSYGKVRATRIDGKGYSEWTFVGEPIHVAKRLHELPDLVSPNPVCGAFGIKVPPGEIAAVLQTLKARLSIVAGFASRFSHRLIPQPVELKGVGEVCCAVLLPQARTSA